MDYVRLFEIWTHDLSQLFLMVAITHIIIGSSKNSSPTYIDNYLSFRAKLEQHPQFDKETLRKIKRVWADDAELSDIASKDIFWRPWAVTASKARDWFDDIRAGGGVS